MTTLLRLEEERGEVDEVVAPDHPGVHAGGFDGGDGHVFGFEEGDELAVGFEEMVFGAAGDPEELEVGGFGVEGGEAGPVDAGGGGGEADDVGELIGVVEAGGEGLEAAHGEAGDGAVFAFFGGVVLGLDAGEDLGEEGLGVEVGVFGDGVGGAPGVEAAEDEAHVAVAEGHDDDHGLDLALGEERVEDEIGLSHGDPAVGAVGVAVEEIQDGVVAFPFRVVAGRCVDEEVGLVLREAEDDGGGVEVVVDLAMGDVLGLPGLGGVAGDGDEVGEVEEVGGEAGVVGVEAGLAVDVEVVAVNLGREGFGGGGPGAAGVLLFCMGRLGPAPSRASSALAAAGSW